VHCEILTTRLEANDEQVHEVSVSTDEIRMIDQETNNEIGVGDQHGGSPFGSLWALPANNFTMAPTLFPFHRLPLTCLWPLTELHLTRS